jgi:cobalt-zinc-cadmium efflux system outer membrane protein
MGKPTGFGCSFICSEYSDIENASYSPIRFADFAVGNLAWLTAFSAFGRAPVASTPTLLSQLLAEAGANNPQISAANCGVRASPANGTQMTTLRDPKFTYQQLSVGSPKPFAGYNNSDFACIGIGASQELPYPGKLQARGAVAERDAGTKQAEVEVTKTSIVDAVKADYLQVGYLQQTLDTLRQNESVLDQLIQDATAHYQVEEGMQQDVLQAQVNRTKIVKERLRCTTN